MRHSKDGRIVISSNSLIRGFTFSAFSAISNLTPSCTYRSTGGHGVNTSTNTNRLPKSTTRNRPVNTWCPQVNYACRNRRLTCIPGGWGCRWTILYPGDINTEAWSTSLWLGVGMTPSPCTNLSRNCKRCKPGGVRTDDPAKLDVGVTNRNTKSANSMEWRSFLGVVTARTRL